MDSTQSRNKTVTIVVVAAIIGLTVLLACLCCVGIGAVGVYWFAQQDGTSVEPTPSASDLSAVLPDSPESALNHALLQRLYDTPTTDTDYWLLYGQLRSDTGVPVPREPVLDPIDHQVGDVHTFWLSDEEQHRYWEIEAELQVKAEHSYFYVDSETSFDMDDLQAAATLFESKILANNRAIFGLEWTPGIDNDPRLTILVTHQMPAGIAGYFSSTDEYPKLMQPHSNEREMIYVTSEYLQDGDEFGQLLSHELQHMIHWNQDRSEAVWVNEGLSLLAEEVNGYASVLGGREFWRDPDVQLTNWAEDPNDRYRNYAASKLFLSYLGEHYGGYDIMGRLAADPAYGIDGITDLLGTGGYRSSFEDVFADWVVANLLDDESLGKGQYAYALGQGNKPTLRATLGPDASYSGWVRQFGTDYVAIRPGDSAHVAFRGSGQVRLVASEPHSGQFAWWANRRDMLNSSLTREVDLTETRSATLQFWTWYDIEENFDYGYVAVSADEGRTWEILPGLYTTSMDPNKASYGDGYTGKSREWLSERVDLGPFVGRRILLRFWYVGDPGQNQPGWLVDDISIPEIGFSDDVEQESKGWIVDGFVRSSNTVPQSYIVQVVEYGPETTIRRLDLEESNQAQIALDDETKWAVLVISGTARWTSEAAPYQVQVKVE